MHTEFNFIKHNLWFHLSVWFESVSADLSPRRRSLSMRPQLPWRLSSVTRRKKRWFNSDQNTEADTMMNLLPHGLYHLWWESPERRSVPLRLLQTQTPLTTLKHSIDILYRTSIGVPVLSFMWLQATVKPVWSLLLFILLKIHISLINKDDNNSCLLV